MVLTGLPESDMAAGKKKSAANAAQMESKESSRAATPVVVEDEDEKMRTAMAEAVVGLRSSTISDVEQTLAKLMANENHEMRKSAWQEAAAQQGLVSALVALLDAAMMAVGDSSATDAPSSTLVPETVALAALRFLARVSALPGPCRSELARETNNAIVIAALVETSASSESTLQTLLLPAVCLLTSLIFSASTAVSALEANQCARGRGVIAALSAVISRQLPRITPDDAVVGNEEEQAMGDAPEATSVENAATIPGATGAKGNEGGTALCEASLRLMLFMCRSYQLKLTMTVSTENGGLVALLVRIVATVTPRIESTTIAAELLARLMSGPILLRRAAASTLDAASAVTSLLDAVVHPCAPAAQEAAMLAIACIAETGAPSVRDALERDGFAVSVILGLLEEQERAPTARDEPGEGKEGCTGTTSKDSEMDAEAVAAATAAAEESEREAIARSTVMATVFGLNEVEDEGDDEDDEEDDDSPKPRPVESTRSAVLQASALRAMLAMMHLQPNEQDAPALLNDFLDEARPDLPGVLERIAFSGPLSATSPSPTRLAAGAGDTSKIDVAPEALCREEAGTAETGPSSPAVHADASPPLSPPHLRDDDADTENHLYETSFSADPSVVVGAISVLRMLLRYEQSLEQPMTTSASAAAVVADGRQSVTEFLLAPDVLERICSTLTSTTSEELKCEILDFIADLSMELSIEQRSLLRTNGVLAALKDFAKMNPSPKGLLRAKLASTLLCFATDDFIPPEKPSEENVEPKLFVPKTAYDWDALGRESDRTTLMLL